MDSYKVIISSKAYKDLEEITIYLGEFDPYVAGRIGDKLLDRAETLANPLICFAGMHFYKAREGIRLMKASI